MSYRKVLSCLGSLAENALLCKADDEEVGTAGHPRKTPPRVRSPFVCEKVKLAEAESFSKVRVKKNMLKHAT